MLGLLLRFNKKINILNVAFVYIAVCHPDIKTALTQCVHGLHDSSNEQSTVLYYSKVVDF